MCMDLNYLEKEINLIVLKYLSRPEFHDVYTSFKRHLASSKELQLPEPSRCCKRDEDITDVVEQEYKHISTSSLVDTYKEILRCIHSGPGPGLKTILGHTLYSTPVLLSQIANRDTEVQIPKPSFNICTKLLKRQKNTSRHDIMKSKTNTPSLITRILGHLAPVYCVVIDRTSTIAITGADDALIKIWSMETFYLKATLRGHRKEICDLSIHPNNTILASGSCDRDIRIWCLRTTRNLFILEGHRSPISKLDFSPNCDYLVSIGYDGHVCFWPVIDDYTVSDDVAPFFEKVRSSTEKLVSSDFSAGGNFFAVGSHDGAIFLYEMTRQLSLPQRSVTLNGHTSMVITLAFARNSLRFISGSKDGTLRIWTKSPQGWEAVICNSRVLLKTRPGDSASYDSKSVYQNSLMLAVWNSTEKSVMGCCSDNSIRIWNLQGECIQYLLGHDGETYVVLEHPRIPYIVYSCGHDGIINTWNIETGQCLHQFLNVVEGEGRVGIYEAVVSPNGEFLVSVDANGHIEFFGDSFKSLAVQVPPEQFFNTDYFSLIWDRYGHVHDEQAEVPPHMLGPPYMVDQEAYALSPEFQVNVPGRYLLTEAQIKKRREEKKKKTIMQKCISALLRQTSRVPARSSEEAIVNPELAIFQRSFLQVVIDSDEIPHVMPPLTRYDLFQGILERSLANIDPREANKRWVNRKIVNEISDVHRSKLRKAQKAVRDSELDKIRKIEVDAKRVTKTNQPRSRRGKNSKKTPAVRQTRQQTQILEEESELPETETEASLSTSDEDWTAKRTKKKCYRVVVNQSDSPPSEELEELENSFNNKNDESDEVGRERWALRKSRKIHTSSEYTDSSKENKSESKEETKATSSKTKAKVSDSDEIKKQGNSQSKQRTNNKRKNKKTHKKKERSSNEEIKAALFEKPSEWVTAIEPTRSPYLPQLSDIVYYFVQGHMDYLHSDLCSEYGKKYVPWRDRKFKDAVKCKVIALNFLTGPPTVCQITLVPLGVGNNYNSKDFFTFFYHDADTIPDFMVLQRHYEDSIRLNWKKGDAFRCLIDNYWWRGVVLRKSVIDKERFPNSSWRQIVVKWDNEEGTERLSAWDIEPLPRDSRSNKAHSPTKKHAGTSSDDVLQISFVSNRDQGPLDPYIMHYYHSSSVWLNETREEFKQRLSVGITDIMERPEARDFVYPVNITDNPDYYSIVAYPTDLTTIHNRLLNDHYRSKESFLWEARQIEINARAYNEDVSDIIKHASNLVARIFVFVETSSFKRINDEVTPEMISQYLKSQSSHRNKKKKSCSQAKTFTCEWHKRASDILNKLSQHRDSHPFQNPVDLNLYPDYIKYCSDPIDLDTIADNLHAGKYQFEEEFFEDIDRVFTNSFSYNTRTTSRIYQMTVRLRSFYHSLINKLGDKEKSVQPKNKQKQQNHASAVKDDSTSDYSSPSLASSPVNRQIPPRKIYTSSSENDDSDDRKLDSSSDDRKLDSSSDDHTEEERPVTRKSKRKRQKSDYYSQSSSEPRRKSARVRNQNDAVSKEHSVSSSTDSEELNVKTVKKRFCRRSSRNTKSSEVVKPRNSTRGESQTITIKKPQRNTRRNLRNSSNSESSSDQSDSCPTSEATPTKKKRKTRNIGNGTHQNKNKTSTNGKSPRPSRRNKTVIYEEVSDKTPSSVSENESELESPSNVRKSKRTRRKRQLSDFVSYSD